MRARTVAKVRRTVALRKESVDRNKASHLLGVPKCKVALRKESVDRNSLGMNIILCIIVSLSARRAWIEIVISAMTSQISVSLSARRAWIEIANFCKNRFCPTVALRKESVDRNTMRRDFKRLGLLSLSARRAWIEIFVTIIPSNFSNVALRKESVDRNP